MPIVKYMGAHRKSDARVKPGTKFSDAVECFTQRELEIVNLITAGLSSEDVSTRLSVSKRTIDFHLVNVYAKTEGFVNNRVQLTLWKHGITFEK
jgi:ATP/maltotriose-dependent transcriptional regulator MalT